MNDEERFVPLNDLDFQMQTTEPQWGKDNIPEHLRGRAIQVTKYVDSETKEIVKEDIKNQWAIGGISTRDIRLGNLDRWNGEMEYCQHHQDWAMDAMRAFMEDDETEHLPGCPWVASNRVENVIELSHSKGGWFRNRMATFTSETRHTELQPPKNDLMGFRKKQG